MMKQLLIFVATSIFLFSCTKQNREWQYSNTIELGNITPIGFTIADDRIWIADGDHNQLVESSLNGTIKNTFSGFERPMHIDIEDGSLYIPEYGSDQIIEFSHGQKKVLDIPDSLDAPAGVDVLKEEIAIADFYNHRVLYFDGHSWTSFGEEGKEKGQLYYPTDVQILSDQIIVADAYNNRVQIFDKQGNAMQIIGQAEKMNAATGVFADENEIYVTDFENNRVLCYNFEGELKQIITEHLDKPTEIVLYNGLLYISNYKGKNIIQMKR